MKINRLNLWSCQINVIFKVSNARGKSNKYKKDKIINYGSVSRLVKSYIQIWKQINELKEIWKIWLKKLGITETGTWLSACNFLVSFLFRLFWKILNNSSSSGSFRYKTRFNLWINKQMISEKSLNLKWANIFATSNLTSNLTHLFLGEKHIWKWTYHRLLYFLQFFL